MLCMRLHRDWAWFLFACRVSHPSSMLKDYGKWRKTERQLTLDSDGLLKAQLSCLWANGNFFMITRLWTLCATVGKNLQDPYHTSSCWHLLSKLREVLPQGLPSRQSILAADRCKTEAPGLISPQASFKKPGEELAPLCWETAWHCWESPRKRIPG